MATYNGDNNNNFYGGTAGDDFIYGNGGSDALYGKDGNDTISGGTGSDFMIGGAGDDTYLVAKGDGYDVITDDSGTNIIKFSDVASTDVSQVGRSTYLGFDLLLTYGSNTLTVDNYFFGANYNIKIQFSNSVTWNWADIKTLASVAPTAGNDTLYGTYDNDTLSGLDGNDSLSGYAGDDTLNGGAGNDVLDAGFGNDILNGGTGNDSLKGSAGSDTYQIAKNDGQDIIVELNGADTVNFTDVASTDITQVKRGGFGTDLVLTYGNGGQLTVRYYFGTNYASGTTTIEKFHFSDGVNWGWASIAPKVSQGTAGNDTLTGYDDRSDALNGGAGNDTLTGLAGNDLLNGGIGNDVLNGGLGNDVYQIAKNDGSDVINDQAGLDSIKFTDVASTDITQISRLASDYGLGMDLLVKYGNANQVVIHGYFFNANVDSGIGAGAVENLQFSDGVNWGLSTVNAKVLEATTGNDLLVGYNDRSDALNGLAGNDSLYGLDGNDILTGGAGNDLLYGGLGNDLYLIAKNDGSDTLDDQGGTTDVVKFTDVASTDITGVSRTYDGSLLVKYGSSQVTIKNYFYTGDSISIEKLLFSNGVVWNAATIALKVAQATAGDDMLFGSDNKDDVLNGYSGNDQLYGLGGNDTLNGGPGNDSMSGGYGNDSYWVDSVGDTISEYADQGTDTVYSSVTFDLLSNINIENLTLLAAAQSGSGNNLDNILTGNAAANVLSGGNGNDSLYGGDSLDSLNGGAGSDLLDGGNGFDIAQYYTATAGVTVNLSLTTAQNTGGAGTDTLVNIEAINGSAYNDTLTGNTVSNTLLGGAGNDVLDGGLANDKLTGGQGADTFVFSSALSATNLDTITDFSVIDDTIQLDNSIFTALTSTGALAANEFLIIGNGAVADSNDYIQYNSVSGGLFYDADGSGAGAAVEIAVLGTGLAMTSADFMVA